MEACLVAVFDVGFEVDFFVGGVFLDDGFWGAAFTFFGLGAGVGAPKAGGVSRPPQVRIKMKMMRGRRGEF